MTTVYVLAALLVLAAAFFAIVIASPVRVVPRRPEPQPEGIEWKVDFRLWFPSGRAGYIVQHVRIRERVTDCRDPQFAQPFVDRTREFWEAWPVSPRTMRPEAPPPSVPAHDYDDNFRFGIPKKELNMNGHGRVRIEVRGVVRFFPGVTLPATFRRRNPATQAGYALSDANRPPFWRPGGTQHDLVAEWEHCPGTEMHWKSVDETPKFRE